MADQNDRKRRPYGGTDAGFSIPSLAGGETTFGDAGAADPIAVSRQYGRPARSLLKTSSGPTANAAAAPAPAPAPRPAAAGGAAPAARSLDPRPDFSNVQSAATPIAPGPLGRNSYVNAANQTQALTAQQQAPDLRPQRVYAPASTAPAVQGATQRALDGQRGATLAARADAADMLNPMSAGAEIMRRLENSQRSYFNRGSPSARANQAQAYMGQLAAMNAASAAGQGAANATLQAGAAGESQAAEAQARRTLEADQFNVQSQQADRELEQSARGPSSLGLIRGLDGTTSFVRNDGSVQTLRDEAGNAIQAPGEGGVTPRDLFNARNAEIQAVLQNEMMQPTDRQAAVEEINARYAAMGGGQRGAGKPADAAEFIRRARAAGRTESDAELTAFFNSKQGN